MDTVTVVTPVGCIGNRGVDRDALLAAVEKIRHRGLRPGTIAAHLPDRIRLAYRPERQIEIGALRQRRCPRAGRVDIAGVEDESPDSDGPRCASPAFEA